MSGVSGIFSIQPNNYKLQELAPILHNRLSHRGGYDEGYCLIPAENIEDVVSCFGKGTTKQAIEQNGLKSFEDASRQNCYGIVAQHSDHLAGDTHFPYHDRVQNIIVLFDGRIINTHTLAKDLQFDVSAGETVHLGKLLAAAYSKWGENISSQLAGRFTIVIIDLNEEKIVASRDAFGVKPFYFFQTEHFFGFASEIKSFFPLPFLSKRLDRLTVFYYLALGQAEPHGASFFKHIHELQPGYTLIFLLKNRVVKSWCYYRLTTDAHFGKYRGSQNAGYNHKIKRLLAANIQNHLRGLKNFAVINDGSFGAAAIAFLIRLYEQEVKVKESFEKILVEPLYGEHFCGDADFAHSLSQHLKFKNQIISVVENFKAQQIENIVYQQELPFTSFDVVVQYKQAEKIKELGLDTIFLSTGSDLIFGGRPDHFALHLISSFKKGYYNEFFLNWFNVSSKFITKANLLQLFAGKLLWNKEIEQIEFNPIQPSQVEMNLLKQELWDKNSKKAKQDDDISPDNLNQYLLAQFSKGVLKQSLRTLDRNMAYFNQQYEVPFAIDKELAQLLFKIQSVYKIRYGRGAMMLRRAMKDIMPDNLLYKHLSNHSQNCFAETLFENADQFKPYFNNDLNDYLNVDYIHKHWDKLFSLSSKANPDILWRIVNFAVWRKIYLYDKE